MRGGRGGGAGAGAGAETAADLALDRLGIISVTDPEYGAVGDGSADDTLAIQRAIDDAFAAGGASVFLPPGRTYSLGASASGETLWNHGSVVVPTTNVCLIMRTGVHLFGGPGSVLKPKASAGTRTAIFVADGSRSSIRSLEIDGSLVTGSGHGIFCGLSTNNDDTVIDDLEFADLYIHHVRSYGIGIQVGLVTFCRIHGVQIFSSGADGIDIKNRSSSFDNKGFFVSDLYIDTFGQNAGLDAQAGLDIRGIVNVSNIQIINCGLSGKTQVGIRFRTLDNPGNDEWGRRSTLHGLYVRGTNSTFANTVGLSIGSAHVAVSGGTIEDCFTGVHMTSSASGDADHISVTGVTVVDSDDAAFRTTSGADFATLTACHAIDSNIGFFNGGQGNRFIACEHDNCVTPATDSSGDATTIGCTFGLGAANTIQMMDATGAFPKWTSTVKTDGAALMLGASPAPSGDGIRFTSGQTLGWNSGVSPGTSVLGMQLNSSDNLVIGSGTLVASQFLRASTSIRFEIGATLQGRWLSGALELGFGGTAATSGAMRFANTGDLNWRNAANTGNILGLRVDANDDLNLGGTGSGIPDNILYSVAAAGSHQFRVDGSTELTLTATDLILADGNDLRFGSGSTNPLVYQLASSTATDTTTRTLELRGQDKSGNTSTANGNLLTRAGDATGAGGTHVGGHRTDRAGDATGASGTRTGGDYTNRAGTGATQDGSWHVLSNNTSTLEVARVSNARRVTALNRGALITSTQMPTNTGDLVTFIGNAATAPTAAPAGGAILLASNGALAGMNSGKLSESITAVNTGDATGTFKQYQRRETRVQTTNATITTLDSLTLTAGSVQLVTARVHARKDATDKAGYLLRVLAAQEGGTAAIVGTLIKETFETAGAAAWDATINVSGNAVRVQVTGAAATTIEWWIYWEVSIWQP